MLASNSLREAYVCTGDTHGYEQDCNACPCSTLITQFDQWLYRDHDRWHDGI